MKAMVFAAGLGTRLKPWTEKHPKALVPVGGVPMLERVLVNLRESGFDDVVVNVHHFADQVTDFLSSHDFGIRVRVSDERELLLDTGGGLLAASPMLFEDDAPVLIHNVDILSNANLNGLMNRHIESGADATLLVSGRNSSRRLAFDGDGRLRGWHNVNSGEYRPAGYVPSDDCHEVAFSGIHVVGPEVISRMRAGGYEGKFPIMDFYLGECERLDIREHYAEGLELIDIGKPETLAEANQTVGDY